MPFQVVASACGRQRASGRTPGAGAGRANRAPLRHTRVRLALLVPDRGRVRHPLRPWPGRPVRVAQLEVPGGRRVRGAAVRVGARARAEPLGGGPGFRPAGAPHPALPARRVLRDRAGTAHPGPGVPGVGRRPADLAGPGGRRVRAGPRVPPRRGAGGAAQPARCRERAGRPLQLASRPAAGRRPDAPGGSVEAHRPPEFRHRGGGLGRARPGGGGAARPAGHVPADGQPGTGLRRAVAGGDRRVHVDRRQPVAAGLPGAGAAARAAGTPARPAGHPDPVQPAAGRGDPAGGRRPGARPGDRGPRGPADRHRQRGGGDGHPGAAAALGGRRVAGPHPRPRPGAECRPVRHGADRGGAALTGHRVPAGRAVRPGVRRARGRRPGPRVRRGLTCWPGGRPPWNPPVACSPVPSSRGLGRNLSGVISRRGPFAPGDQAQLTDPKGRRHLAVLQPGKVFHTHRGSIALDDLIGSPEGSVVRSSAGTPYVALRPLLADFTLSMTRGAAVVYPKDAAQILAMADIWPGARVLEAGAGSGALSCWLLRAVGPDGLLVSYERRADFADIARANVERFFGEAPAQWQLRPAELGADASAGDEPFDRVVLDMLAPWVCVGTAARALLPGGVLACYVATVTQLSATVEAVRGHGGFDEPSAWESLSRGWHADGLAVRPEHRMVGHTGFLVTARRLAEGVTAPPRRRRPAKGAHDPQAAG